MKRILLSMLSVLFAANAFAQINIDSFQAQPTAGGLNVIVSFNYHSVAYFRNFDYTVAGDQIQLRLCYVETPLTLMSSGTDTLFIAVPNNPSYTINANFFSTPNSTMGCEYVNPFYNIGVTLKNSGFHQLDKKIRIFPNPVTGGKFQVQSDEVEIRKITISDLTGKLLKDVMSGRVDVSELSSGLYFANIHTDNGVITKKILIAN